MPLRITCGFIVPVYVAFNQFDVAITFDSFWLSTYGITHLTFISNEYHLTLIAMFIWISDSTTIIAAFDDFSSILVLSTIVSIALLIVNVGFIFAFLSNFISIVVQLFACLAFAASYPLNS